MKYLKTILNLIKMTQYNSLNVKLSNSQLNKLKSSIKNETDVVLRLSANMVSNSIDNTNTNSSIRRYFV